ncbi:MAG: glycosyltransferase family 39 protein [Pyrinomonadaceae bacterium]|nr:glycosyltransferase family 39 protein [Pyrinomonadaceae bacterium]
MPTYGVPAVVLCGMLSAAVGFGISRIKEDGPFLLQVFIGGLLVRMLVGALIFVFKLQEFFGGDAFTYDFFGGALLKVWQGERFYMVYVEQFVGTNTSGGGGWGMLYYVASIYRLVGPNMLAVQFVNAVVGAATAPLIYLSARHIFNNQRTARLAALFVAFFPSLVLWSAQGLKDGPIVFLLSFAMLATLKLGEKLSLKYVALLALALFCLLSLRFYIFYMVVAAIAGSFVIGMREASARNFLRQFVVVVILGLSLTYLGVTRYASSQFENYANLQAVQRSRSDLAASAKSGFGKDVDVSTTGGAITAIPVGFLYLILAPFPWQLASLRQMIPLPEMLVWWASFPMLVLGFWYSIKFRLRQISPILIFTSMLTLAYSVFQGNVGTAYRQRAQILVFYFMFVAVGFVLMKERREDRKRQQLVAARQSHPVFARRSSPNA